VTVPDGYYSWGGTESTRQYIVPCPAGMFCVGGIKRACAAGRYSLQGSASAVCDGLCSAGYYCLPQSSSPTQYPCPAGRFGGEGMTNAGCGGSCAAGYFCPLSSTSPYQYLCGSDTVYCPRGSGTPLAVQVLHFSTGGDQFTRSSQTLCNTSSVIGTPPAGSSRKNICPSTTV
jgi:hypothetical protein